MKTLLLLCACGVSFHCVTGAERIENLTLEGAMELAERNHPDFVEVRAIADAARARRAQAGKLANPEAVARIESAPFNGRTADSAEYVAGVSQSIPLGGRLSASREVAQRELEAAEARTELRRRELRSRVHSAFATALYFDAALVAFSNNLAGAEALTRITKARLEAGDALREDVARAEVDELHAGLETKAAETARRLAMNDLATEIGNNGVEVGVLSGSLTNALALPQIQDAATELGKSPAVSVAESESAAQRARVQLVKAQRIPDINFDLFYRRLQETRQDAFDAGIRIPIPLFNRSGARVREATAEAESAEARLVSTRLNSQQQVNRALSELNRALESARVFGAEVLPRAQLVITNAEARYKAGDASLADVLQKRREWNSTQTSYLQALRDTHDAWRSLRFHVGTASRN
jgi:outer membrane protein, heavy metal efflux system